MKPLEALLSALLAQRDRWVLWAPVFLAVGIGIYFSLPVEPSGALSAGVVAGAALAGFALKRNRALLLFGWLPVFLIALGFGAAHLRAERVAAPLLRKKTPPMFFTGTVVESEYTLKGYRVTLEDLSVDQELGQALPGRARVRLKKKDPAVPRVGDSVTVRAVLLPLSPPVAPGAFDFRRHGYFEGLGATGYAIGDVVLTPDSHHDLFEKLRHAIRARIEASDAREGVKALTAAFLIGDAGRILPEDWRVARQAGIAHLVAISGSHFMMIVGAVFFALRALLAAIPGAAVAWPIKKIAAGAGIAAAVFYMLLIGAPLPAQRAALMSAVVMLAVMLDRNPFSLRLAAFAAFVLLLIKPESLIGASFQLSFSAVVGMIAFFDATHAWWSARYRAAGAVGRFGLFLLMLVATSLVAGFATAPYALYHFLQVALPGGLIANLIAVPLSSFVTFPAGLIASVLMPFGLEKIPLWIMQESVEVIMSVAATVADWPWAGFSVPAWPMSALVAVTLGLLWMCLWGGRLRWLGVLPLAVAPLWAATLPRPDVFVGGSFRLLAAVRDQATGGLSFSPGRADQFTRKAWLQREGLLEAAAPWPDCEGPFCWYSAKGQAVAFAADDSPATPELCGQATVIVTPRAKRPEFACAARVIDKWDLYYGGGHSVFLKEGAKPHVFSAGGWQGVRPWSKKRILREGLSPKSPDSVLCTTGGFC